MWKIPIRDWYVSKFVGRHVVASVGYDTGMVRLGVSVSFHWNPWLSLHFEISFLIFWGELELRKPLRSKEE